MKEHEREYERELVESYDEIYKMLNDFFERGYTFSKKDMLFNFVDERNMSLVIKGVIVTLVNLKYIVIVSKVGHFNYLYKMEKKLDF